MYNKNNPKNRIYLGQIFYGAGICLGGAAVSFGSYELAAPGGTYVVASGMIAVGAWYLGKGLVCLMAGNIGLFKWCLFSFFHKLSDRLANIINNRTNISRTKGNTTLHFKSNLDAFEYAKSYMGCSVSRRGFLAIALDEGHCGSEGMFMFIKVRIDLHSDKSIAAILHNDICSSGIKTGDLVWVVKQDDYYFIQDKILPEYSIEKSAWLRSSTNA